MNNSKIKFNLEGWRVWGFKKPGLHDYENKEESDFAQKERNGYLLFLSEMPFLTNDNKWVKFPCAVVEDEDGKVYINHPRIYYSSVTTDNRVITIIDLI